MSYLITSKPLKKTHLMLLTLLPLSMVQHTFAGVTVYSDNVSLQSNEMNSKQFFSQSGLSTNKPEEVNGAGSQMGLPLSIKIIVPDDWVVNTSGDYNNTVVSWVGGMSWAQILRHMSQSEHIYMSLDWVKKTVNINIPKNNTSTRTQSTKTKNKLKKEKAQYVVKKNKYWKKRNSLKNELSIKESQIVKLINKQHDAQKSNNEYIAKLLKSNNDFKNESEKLKISLHQERQEREAIENKYKVLDPTNMLVRGTDAITLHERYEKAWVLPFDSSFDYYLKGGFSDQMTAETQGTYLAKTGTIKNVISKWGDALGWVVDYRATVQHKNPYEVEFKGNFYDVSIALIDIFKKSRRPLSVNFYPDVITGNGKKGLVVIDDLNFVKK